MPHADTLINYEHTSEKAFEYVSVLLSKTASYWYSKGNSPEALRRSSQAYDVSIQHFERSSDLHRTHFLAQLRLANAHSDLGHHEKAEKCARSLVADAVRFLDPRDWRIVNTLNLLGRVLGSGGKYTESEDAFKKALSLCEESFGKDAPETLNTLANLASVLGKRFEMEEALVLYHALMSKSTRPMGEYHPAVLLYSNNYGCLLTSIGRHQEAEAILYDTYLKTEKIYTDNHPETLRTMGNYALVLAQQAKHMEAKKWTDRTLLIIKQIPLEQQNPLMIRFLHNAGTLEIDLGNTEQGRALLKKALAMETGLKLQAHPNTFVTMKMLGECEMRLCEYTVAEDWFSRAHIGLARELGIDHILSLEAAVSLTNLRRAQGRYDECEKFLPQAVSMFQRVYGPDHWKPIELQVTMAQVLSDKGRHEESFALMKMLQTLTSTRYGEKSLRNLSIQHFKALVLGQNSATYDESIFMFKQVLIGYEQQGFDERYHKFVLARVHYANVLSNCGRIYESEEISRLKVSICRLKLGSDNETTLRALKGLALVLSRRKTVAVSDHDKTVVTSRNDSKKSFEEHESCARELLEIRKEICLSYTAKYGQDSRQALAAGFDIASCLIISCQYRQALEVCEDIFSRRKQFLGQRDLEFLESCHQKAHLLRLLQLFQEAEALNRETIDIRHSILGEDSHAAMDSKTNLALCMRGLELPEQALQIDIDLLDRKHRIYGPNSPKVLDAMNNLAMDYFDLLQYGEAERLLEKVVHEGSEKIGPNHIDTALSLQNLGETLLKLEKWKEAEPMLRRALDIRIVRLGQDHDSVDKILNHLHVCLHKQGRSNEATQIAEKQLQHRKECLGLMHPRTLSSRADLALVLDLDNDSAKAEYVYREYFDLRRGNPDKDVLNRLQRLSSFSYVLWQTNKQPEALRVCRKVFKGREVLQGTDHPETLFSGIALIVCLHELGRNDEAQTLCCDVLARSETSLGVHHCTTLLLMQRLVSISRSPKKKR